MPTAAIIAAMPAEGRLLGGEGRDGGVDGNSSICFYWEVNLFFFLGFVSAFFGSRGVGGAVFGGGGVERMVEGDGESCGSRAGEVAVVLSPTRPRQKLEVYNEVLRRLRESGSPEAAADGFDDELWRHFARLPIRFLLLPRFRFAVYFFWGFFLFWIVVAGMRWI